jgi:YesN/AraC family two-component response regulator
MPAVNGLDMVESILQVNPDMKILVISGYSDNVIEQQGRNRLPFIRKPFIYRMLIEKIQSIVAPQMQQLQERNSFTLPR